MGTTQIGLGLWLVLMAGLVWAVWQVAGWWFRRRLRRISLPRPAIHFAPKLTGSEKIPALRQNLLLKVGRDEAVFERLIEFERARLPNAPLHTLLESAIERWERDNR